MEMKREYVQRLLVLDCEMACVYKRCLHWDSAACARGGEEGVARLIVCVQGGLCGQKMFAQACDVDCACQTIRRDR